MLQAKLVSLALHFRFIYLYALGLLSGVERRGRRGREAPGDTIWRGDTKKKI